MDIDAAEAVLRTRQDIIGTHWDDCWRSHSECLAWRLVAEVRRLREALDEIKRIGEPRPDIHDAEDAANACIYIAEKALEARHGEAR